MNCPNCQSEVADDATFCSRCGTSLTSAVEVETSRKCAQCGAEIGLDDAFCPGCGRRVQQAASIEEAVQAPPLGGDEPEPDVSARTPGPAAGSKPADEIQTPPAGPDASEMAAFASPPEIQPWVIGALVVSILVGVIAVIADIDFIGIAEDLAAGRGVTEAEIFESGDTVDTMDVIQIVVFIPTAILFLVWINQAYKNLYTFIGAGLKFSPGWAVGGFFVPVLNLWRPYEVMREIWRASSADASGQRNGSWRSGELPTILGIWWGIWIAALLLYMVARITVGNVSTADDLVDSAWVILVADLFLVAAAALTIATVQAFTARQVEAYRSLKDTPNRPA